ncbi:response regulator receiver domain [Agrobacterium rhizogenes]|uniref:response regulator receiver domain n=1 Tax=Rhizobium rhizogenes TaxID=359 RepID=UPI0022B68F50|nr:response regulator receiver domain [Rhizobium rhizogenes]MCZ7450224.1 response regulator receiver domain [Rhizobium rhizogenes]
MEKNYDDLITEAFIKPIRSVLIVDDDYPTLHEILLDDRVRDTKHGHKNWKQNRDKVRKVIEEFRASASPCLLDIHDGTSPTEDTEEEQIHRLHQTDLLILDYQLDKNKAGDGSKAVAYARAALANKHFTLILVHTQEDLDRVFQEFLIGLSVPRHGLPAETSPQELQDFIDEHEDELLSAVKDSQYIWTTKADNRDDSVLTKAVHSGTAPWGDLKALLEKSKLHRRAWFGAAKYALQIFEDRNAARFAKIDLGVSYWGQDDAMFIRGSRGFIAFKSKNDGEELLPAVQKALSAWNPRPPRLMLTKLRAEMNERGIEVQDAALGEPDVGAMWYRRVLEADQHDLDAIVNRTVRNHAEQLMDRLLPNVSAFAKEIRLVDKGRDPTEVVKSHFKVDLKDMTVLTKARMGHNAFVGSKPARSPHLELGHILKIGQEYWLCLTPACDMVPRVHRGRPWDRMDGIKRFTALQLLKKKDKDAILDASRGGHIFANILNDDGTTERLAFSAARNVGSSPAWMMMYVRNDGYLPGEDAPHCEVSYVSPPKTKRTKNLQMKHATATVCGMLRYEYALEIQSRFITSQSRIGLDFVDDRDSQSPLED